MSTTLKDVARETIPTARFVVPALTTVRMRISDMGTETVPVQRV